MVQRVTGFVLGPPVALALNLPFYMLRKKGKMPNAVSGEAYTKEYAGNDVLCIPRDSIKPGDRVLLIDDLVVRTPTLPKFCASVNVFVFRQQEVTQVFFLRIVC